ncbi:acetyl-CoA C-acetyltransferase [Pseudaminobacter salicylatoxidans]|uniref:Beta-ketothiolase n=1 Tax=Pseudaminobacter salicylatoxidans TaxID=93369 RepID=A0A316C9Z1_PSESE|nr:beta-ketothiolase BktB [Pseudaminobacter salicylatoxidans]PWJ86599.1 acetyl-CoA C-acetyltransferase [Pseudaminobacter salicylatoxidans]
MSNQVVFVSAARTAIGSFGRSLKDVPATRLATTVLQAAVSRAGIETARVGHVVFGNVIHGEPRDAYLARVAALEGGLGHGVPCLTLNRLCGSGLQAIVSAAQSIMLGDTDCAVAGGAESMSRGGYLMPALRDGQRLGDAMAIDMVVGVLTDPFGNGHMGITAENVATRCGIAREEQDGFAVVSHRRAAAAIAEGRFRSQIVPVEIKGRKGTVVFDQDEHVRADVSVENLAGLRPAFARDGSVTAGNASGINDGAAALVLMEEDVARAEGREVLGRLVSYAHSGLDPAVMGLGPVEATRKALARASIGIDDLKVIESNEAFAAQACAVSKELGFPAEITNPNGGAIALGHPVGATGAILTVKALYELQRLGGGYGLITMCIGGGQGIAMVVKAG